MRSIFIAGVALAFGLSACKKPEGEGGKSSISGKVFQIDYIDDRDHILDTFPAVDEDVYIVYGGGSLADDDVKTNYDGEFSFEHLRPGDYSIYVYSRDQEQSELSHPVQLDINLGKKDSKDLEDIYIYRNGKGHSTVTGKIFKYDYSNEWILKDQGYAGDVDVFLCREGSATYIDKTKTNFDGTYQFPFLRKGNYSVYAYSKKDTLKEGGLSIYTIISEQSFVIDSFAQAITLDDIEIKD